MPRHPDPFTVALPIGAALLRRLDAVAQPCVNDDPSSATTICPVPSNVTPSPPPGNPIDTPRVNPLAASYAPWLRRFARSINSESPPADGTARHWQDRLGRRDGRDGGSAPGD